MLQLALNPQAETRILCLGAHSDDIEIGCGGTILRLIEQNPRLHVRWVVFSASPQRRREAQAGAAYFLAGAARAEVSVCAFRDGFFPYIGAEIKDYFEQIKAEFTPDLVFTHYRHDRHQDHRQISDLTWNTFRSHLILEYEIPKYDGDLGQPNVYVPLDEATARRKIALTVQAFPTQHDKPWFRAETFEALMRVRAVECKAPAGFAEAFHCRKMVI